MTSELESWQMFLAGDEKSFKIIFERYNAQLYNYGFKFTTEEQIIEDSIQEFFVKIWANRNNLTEPASVKNYIFKAFRRILAANLQRHLRFVTENRNSAEDLPFTIELPREMDLIRKERLVEINNMLQLALQKMTPRQREVIHLRFFEELSYDEIAEIIGLSVKDTYKLYYRSLDSLRKHFNSFGLLVLMYLANQLRP